MTQALLNYHSELLQFSRDTSWDELEVHLSRASENDGLSVLICCALAFSFSLQALEADGGDVGMESALPLESVVRHSFPVPQGLPGVRVLELEHLQVLREIVANLCRLPDSRFRSPLPGLPVQSILLF